METVRVTLSGGLEVEVHLDENRMVQIEPMLVEAVAQYVVNELKSYSSTDSRKIVTWNRKVSASIEKIDAESVQVSLDARVFPSQLVSVLVKIASELRSKIDPNDDATGVYVVQSDIDDSRNLPGNKHRTLAYVSTRIMKKRQGITRRYR